MCETTVIASDETWRFQGEQLTRARLILVSADEDCKANLDARNQLGETHQAQQLDAKLRYAVRSNLFEAYSQASAMRREAHDLRIARLVECSLTLD
jgi:hypothetical protein